MADKKTKSITLADLDRAIARRYPTVPMEQARKVRKNIMQYIAKGLDDGFDIALMKPVSDDEIKLKILKLFKDE